VGHKAGGPAVSFRFRHPGPGLFGRAGRRRVGARGPAAKSQAAYPYGIGRTGQHPGLHALLGPPTSFEEPAARTTFVSTYPPRHCGIATFTRDLAAATGSSDVAAIHFAGDPRLYPREVRRTIRRDALDDYYGTAGSLNRSVADVVSVQHEYGIWGGPDGTYVLDFVEALRKPVVTTLHTVPQNPTPSQRRILTELVEASTASVVMSGSAAELLARVYGLSAGRLDVIPHGVPELPLVEADSVKPELGLEPGPMILSFGLIGPGKGYETAIEAMPSVVGAVPSAYYVILGATHPELLKRDGEAYRTRLMRLAESLHVADRVRFVDRYVGQAELGMWLEAADVFITPYPNPDQVVSGTLSYAMSAGKAIVSTPYAYAREMLAGGVGIVVPVAAKPLSEALSLLLRDRDLRHSLGRRAYERSRAMIWPEIGARYRRIFRRVASGRARPRGLEIGPGARLSSA
jgi:glycosyltransferase involved in cell wall biosynthesis